VVTGTADPELIGRLRAGVEQGEAGEDDGGTAEGGGLEWIGFGFHDSAFFTGFSRVGRM
jgi:hypothetical protein